MAVFEERETRKSSGVAKGALATAIGAAVLGVGNAIGTPFIAQNAGNGCYNPCTSPRNPNGSVICGEDRLVDRHDMEKEHDIMMLQAQLDAERAARQSDANDLRLYEFVNKEIKDIRASMCDQRVENQRVSDSFNVVMGKIEEEKKARCCADNAMVSYMNCTFYPKEICDVKVGTTTEPQRTYNPLPCDCSR